MRIQAFTSLAMILLAFASVDSRANPISGSPGWKLEKMEPDADKQESGVIEYADYFALYPSDARPAITIDGVTANRIFAGQLSAESVYFERTSGNAIAAAKAKSESSSGGNGTGWQVAESTYVPLDSEGNAAKNMNATNSSSLLNRAGGANGAAGSSVSGSVFAAAAGSGAASGAVANQVSIGHSAGTTGAASRGAGGFSASLPGKAPAGTVVPYTGDASVANSNQTYSQMIDSAMSNASQSLCGRMGSYAAAGQCK
jgi:hypothetical protein